MENENKPEWFQMADEDRAVQFAKAPKFRKRSTTLVALSAPLMLLGAGLIFAQSTSVASAIDSQPTAQVQSSNPNTTPNTAPDTTPSTAPDTTLGADPTSLVLPVLPPVAPNADENVQSGDDDTQNADDDTQNADDDTQSGDSNDD